jgi:hypothetical protein
MLRSTDHARVLKRICGPAGQARRSPRAIGGACRPHAGKIVTHTSRPSTVWIWTSDPMTRSRRNP